MIEEAYTLGEGLDLAVWCEDEAGPFQTVPHPGAAWRPEGGPARRPHEYVRDGTAKLLTLFRPADGRVRAHGTLSCPNTVLHPWLKRELAAALSGLPAAPPAARPSRAEWERWQEGLSVKPTLPAEPPPLLALLMLDDLAGHKTPALVLWLFAPGVMPLYTPVGGSWLNMAESAQRAQKRRALEGQHPTDPAQIIGWLEAAARHWNADPTPFVWGGRRALRRKRQRERWHRLGGSGALTRRPVARTGKRLYGHAQRE